MTPERLAKGARPHPRRFSELLDGRRGITAEVALRFSQFLGCTPEFWLGLQASYDLEVARELDGRAVSLRRWGESTG